MRIEDTAGNIYIKPGNCDCGLTGGCEKCRGVFIPKYSEYYSPQYYTPNPKIDYHEWMFEQVRCPDCGKILKPHVCGERN